jgi:hypothetical protein
MRRLTAAFLESVGQMRLPGIDELRDLYQPLRDLIVGVKAALKAKITATARSVSVRLATALCTLSGDDREFIDEDSLEADVAACDTDDDALDLLSGLGFVCREFHRRADDKSITDLIEAA